MAITTTVVWGRNLTQAESAELNNQVAIDVAAGETDGTYTGNNMTGVIRTWISTDTANAWISFVNTFSPPPTSAIVTS